MTRGASLHRTTTTLDAFVNRPSPNSLTANFIKILDSLATSALFYVSSGLFYAVNYDSGVDYDVTLATFPGNAGNDVFDLVNMSNERALLYINIKALKFSSFGTLGLFPLPVAA